MFINHCNSIAIGNSSFSNNVAYRSRGVLYAGFASSITVYSSFFNNNQATTAGGVIGAFSHSNLTFKIVNSSFYYNVAGFGGVIYAITSGSSGSITTVTVKNSSFGNNKAGAAGGAIVYTKV